MHVFCKETQKTPLKELMSSKWAMEGGHQWLGCLVLLPVTLFQGPLILGQLLPITVTHPLLAVLRSSTPTLKLESKLDRGCLRG